MELRHLRYFAAAAAEGSFHRAAARLNIVQPALSRQIRDLEEELKVTLFARSAQGAKLTPAGEVLLEEVRKLLPQVEQLKTRTQRAASGKYGLLRIGFTRLAAEFRFTMAALADARRLMPDVDIRFTMVNSDQQTEALMSGEIDMGLLYRRGPNPPELAYQDLRTDKYMLLVANDHPLANRASVKLADLRDENMAFPSPSVRPVTYKEMMGACLKGGLTPRIVLELDNHEAMLNLVSEGIAVCFTNSAMRERRSTQELSFLPIEDLDIPLHFAAMWRKDRETPAIPKFIDLLCQHMDANKDLDKKGQSLTHKLRTHHHERKSTSV